MKKGFTLIELLAVIVILAIIALITVPLVLNIVQESKINSLKISAEEYIRTVNLSLINEQINTNVSDGLYMIENNGKTISLGDKKIDVEYNGNSIESGGLLVENKRVVKIIKGKIDDYYARIENENIKLYKEINASMLVSGETFNKKIKTLVGYSGATISTVDDKVNEIIFLPENMIPYGYTQESLQELPHETVSDDGEIIAYYENKKGIIYIYSKNIIQTNINASYMFQNFQTLTNIVFNLIDTSKTTNMNHMFYRCIVLASLDLKYFNTSKVEHMDEMFNNCKTLVTLDLSSFDTRNVVGMHSLFSSCSELKELNLSSFNTSNVTDMAYMFQNCKSLTKLDVSSFDTLKVNTMNSMFSGCTNLEDLNLNSFDTSKVEYMNSMFSGCTNLTKLNLSNFETINVKDMGRMFGGCSSLSELDVSHFDTSKVTNMASMFEGCRNLLELDLSSFSISNVTSMSRMFWECLELEIISVSDKWVYNDEVITNGMFNSCKCGGVTKK